MVLAPTSSSLPLGGCRFSRHGSLEAVEGVPWEGGG
jgi:hypothetical protein